MRSAAWVVCVASLLLVAAAVVLGEWNGFDLFQQSHLVFVAAAVIVGGLINVRRPGNVIGLLLATTGLSFALLDACGQFALYDRDATAFAWPQTWLWIPANLAIAAIPLFFPTGRLPSSRWRPIIWLAAVAAVLTAIVSALRPGPNDQAGYGTAVANPLGVPALDGATQFADLGFPIFAGALFIAGSISLALRARHARGPERAQVQRLVYAVSLAGLIVIARLVAGLRDDIPDIPWPVRSPFWELAGAAAMTLVLAAISVAVLRYGLFDIDLVINRTLVYGVLSGFVTGGYVLVVGYLGAVFHAVDGLPLSIAAAGLVAVVFAPLRARVQRAVNLLMYGRRDDPYAALALLGRRLEESAEPGAVLATAAGSVAEALKLPYAAIELDEDGDPAPGRIAVPLTYQNEQVGRLVLAPRPGERDLGEKDRRVLADLARRMGIAVHAVRLSADLRRSRERLVLAREEERRRIRNDLHDGLGPTLAALTMRAEAVQDLVGAGPAREMLEEIIGDAAAAMADVRALIDGLRPPALDSLGLLRALSSHVAGLPGEPAIRLEIPAELPELPAATEVAAYHIAIEALTNVRRHARASEARLRLAADGGALTVEVTDNGRGPDGKAGVGTVSMRDRAAELGGWCTIEPCREGGTRVLAILPAQRGKPWNPSRS
ncbi:hypothetical protein Acor_22960 [Acrocarpospora corrugata]|uniref:Histidine kinase/HSP90-like ATPase domain-containing protein n=1 Tax=Acrocarpospora corrugata TaxID=35763 RepID=A0A5M3VYS2_9ACTN|nr:histidine kinase [Acrocarpospora corrugata]GES00233.1 hypothetical protein Acor_22960 [Acrocarpospora corrugata]